MKKIVLSILIVLSLFLITGCSRVKGCKNCVYSRYIEPKVIGDKLSKYKKNYKDVKNKVFIGHVLDDNNKIKKSYVCGIDGNIVFCLEGNYKNSKYKENKKLLNEIYGDKNCSEMETSDGKTYTCSDELQVTVSEKGIIYTSLSKSNQCYVQSDGNAYCFGN